MQFLSNGRRLAALLVVVLAAVALSVAVATARRHHFHGPRNIAPRNHATFAAGSRAHFRVRDHTKAAKKHHVWLTISPVRRVRHGQLKWNFKSSGFFTKMKRHRHGLYTFTSPAHTFPSWFMNKPGTYYWQAHHISCGLHTPRNCHIVGHIRSFTVK